MDLKVHSILLEKCEHYFIKVIENECLYSFNIRKNKRIKIIDKNEYKIRPQYDEIKRRSSDSNFFGRVNIFG